MSDLRMPDINSVFLAGRLTQDPDLRYTANNRAYCRLRLAVSRFYKNRDGERQEETLFINVSCWEKTAEYVNEYFRKGRPMYVEGRLRSYDFEDRDSGQKRTQVEVQAQRIQALDWDDRQGGGGGGGSSAGAGAAAAGGGYGGGAEASSNQPRPRPIEEPVPEDDIPF